MHFEMLLNLRRINVTPSSIFYCRTFSIMRHFLLLLFTFQVWFKNRRAKYRKEKRKCLPVLSNQNYESEDEYISATHQVIPTQNLSLCVQLNKTVPCYCNCSGTMETPRHFCGFSAAACTHLASHAQLEHANGLNNLSYPTSHANYQVMDHGHMGHVWRGQIGDHLLRGAKIRQLQ